MFLFGANVNNVPNQVLSKTAQNFYNFYSLNNGGSYLIRQTAQGEVILRCEGQEIKHLEKKCLSSKQVIDIAIELLTKVGISLENCTFDVVTHEDHTWPLLILRKISRKQKFSVKQRHVISECADRTEPQIRCRSRWLFLLYRSLVLVHHHLKGWI